jgi:hypothetical protein
MGPCEEEQVHYVFFSQPGSVDEKSVPLLLVSEKIEAEEDKKIFIIGIYLVLQDEVV